MKIKNTWKQVLALLKIMEVQFPRIKSTLTMTAFCVVAPVYIQLYFSAAILDQLIKQDFKWTIWYVVIMLGTSALLTLIGNFLMARVETYTQMGEEIIAAQVANKAFDMHYELFEDTSTMDAIRSAKNRTIGSGGIQALMKQIQVFLQSIFACIFACIFLIYLFYQSGIGNLSLFVGVLLGSIVLIYLGFINSEKTQAAYENMQVSNVKANSLSAYLINEHLAVKNKPEVMLNNLTGLFEQYYEKNFINLNFYLEFGKYQGYLYGRYDLFLSLFAGLSYVYVASMTYQGLLSIGSVLMYAGSIQRLSEYMSKLLTAYSNINYHVAYLKQYIEFIDDESSLPVGSLPIEKRNDQQYQFIFKDVSFAYPGTDFNVISKVNLTVNIGEKMAVVGRNGSGKTTLIKLLTRLYTPSEGQILLNGIDIQKYDFNEYCQIFAPVFQDFGILAFDVEANVVCGKEADQSRIMTALEKIGLKDRISRLEEGLLSKLENDNREGVKFSGGEAQKLAIARALYKDAPFVILDEPTAALDPFAEAEIYENFDSLIEDKTAIYISHRMSSCRFCDRIVVLKDGQIVEDGQHQDLLDMRGEYYNLYHAQADYYQ